VLPPESGSDPAFAERFGREARTLARLNHPHIVAVHDFGEAGGLYYLVMEYVDGPNLREVLQTGRLAPEQALAVVPQLCDALQYAHEEGVVHRDVKPENILLDQRGRVKIADFGLAKLLNRPRAEFTLTGSRQVMGTLDYMAPEQRQSPLAIDHRADIYSLGVVFYEMLTGELPLGRFAPPSQKAAIDTRLDDVVFRSLEMDPGRRYQSASELRTDVEAAAGGRGGAVTPRALPAGDRGSVLAAALRQVRGPATGLLVVGLVMIFLGVLGLTILPYSVLSGGPPRLEYHDILLLQAVWGFQVLWGGILVAGGLMMRLLVGEKVVTILCYLGMLPIGGALWVLSLPVSIWALKVLRQESVQAGFAARRSGNGAAAFKRAASTPRPTGPARRRMRGFLRSVRAMFFTTQP
jgi:hypothetical protein